MRSGYSRSAAARNGRWQYRRPSLRRRPRFPAPRQPPGDSRPQTLALDTRRGARCCPLASKDRDRLNCAAPFGGTTMNDKTNGASGAKRVAKPGRRQLLKTMGAAGAAAIVSAPFIGNAASRRNDGVEGPDLLARGRRAADLQDLVRNDQGKDRRRTRDQAVRGQGSRRRLRAARRRQERRARRR